jgi:hypothetical protein
MVSSRLAPALSELCERWRARRDELRKLDAQVPGSLLCDLILADLTSLIEAFGAELLTLTQAARASGYTREHLSRLVRNGKIPNVGRPNAPRVRRTDLPRKPGHLPPQQTDSQIVGASKGQIVRSIASHPHGRSSR